MTRAFPRPGLVLASILAGSLAARTAEAQVTQLVSVSSSGIQGNRGGYAPSISADGRTIAFASFSSNLVPADTNDQLDVFVRDLSTGVTELASVSSTGVQGNNQSFDPAISADGRFVAFFSSATNLDPSHPSVPGQIYVRDRQLQTTEMVSFSPTGFTIGVGVTPSISRDGRFVAFTSFGDLVAQDTNGIGDIYVRDRLNGTTECVSVPTGPVQSVHGYVPRAQISADGRLVAFSTSANNILPGILGPRPSVFLRDRATGSLELISVDVAGNHAIGGSFVTSISEDGRFVVFSSESITLVQGDTNACQDIFVRDRIQGTTDRMSVGAQGVEGDARCSGYSAISADGRYVAFTSLAGNLVPDDTNGHYDVFLRDRFSGSTERLSLTSAGQQRGGDNFYVSISADGRFVAFASDSRLVPGDTVPGADVYVRDRTGGPAFTSLCSPGLDGVTSCPCANPPIGPDRGCDNSSQTGGASLSAIGGAFVSSDSLEFRVLYEKTAALSILLQGTAASSTGVLDGQGVRCVGGTMLRLFSKRAVGWSLVVPDFQAGDATVSSRSAGLGDQIGPGEQRWYSVLYRDPVVLGGCPASSTFNSTQSGRVDWAP